MQFDTTINKWHTAASTGRINGSNPCSEYMHLDNSACNLASLNLMTFLDDQDVFDVEGFKAATSVVFTAQEIIVGNGDYPTAKIAKTTRRFRQLGIGYANLGALLMAQGLAYDSDGGRAWAGAITALLTGQSYATSARTAARMGPFAGYQENRTHMLKVLGMHRDAVNEIDEELVPVEILDAARSAWDEACNLGEVHGVRNSQASVLAPTGTIGLLMDCDTTGIEPDLGLVKMKKLVGGGTMSIVNQTVPRGADQARLLRSSRSTRSRPTSRSEKSILGAPHIVAVALRRVRLLDGRQHDPLPRPHQDDGGRAAVPLGRDLQDGQHARRGHGRRSRAAAHRVVAARPQGRRHLPRQLQGRPAPRHGQEGSGRERLRHRRRSRWRRRCADRCSVGRSKVAELEQEIERHTVFVKQPVRERLPNKRRSTTTKFRVADCEGYFTVGEYDDGRPGEVFISVSKQGSTLSGLMDAFAVSISLGLQHGVPLSTYVKKYANSRFEPSGMTDDPELRIATSLMDYIFRRIAVDYMPFERARGVGHPHAAGADPADAARCRRGDGCRSRFGRGRAGHVGSRSRHVVAVAPAAAAVGREPPKMVAPKQNEVIAPLCYSCGNEMQRAGSCYVCGSCGSTSGCS